MKIKEECKSSSEQYREFKELSAKLTDFFKRYEESRQKYVNDESDLKMLDK